MPDLTLPLILLVAGGAMVLGMWRMDVFTPRAVVAWTRMGRHHLTDDRPLDERLADRGPSLACFFRQTSGPHVLAISNPARGPEHVAGQGRRPRAARGGGAHAEGLLRQRELRLAALPVAALPPGCGCYALLSSFSLRREARHRQDAVNQEIAQSLSPNLSAVATDR